LAECKDKGPITINDVSNLKRIAESLPTKRFETFIILSQISLFTDDEIKIAKTLNDQYHYHAILLSTNELEPFYLLGRAKDKSGIELSWSSPKEMAKSTAQLYFLPKEVDVDNKNIE
jgi:hypothetical protein